MELRTLKLDVAVALSGLVFSGAFGAVAHAGETCKDSAGNSPCVGTNSPCVCVGRAGDDPDEGFDVNFDFSDASNPDVELVTGGGWTVFSKEHLTDTTPDNLGDVTINPAAQSSEDFSVTFANGANAGAAKLGSAVLKDRDWTGYSSVAGGTITGNLIGALGVVEDTGANGGELTLTIEGDAKSNITVATIKSLVIEGDLSGDIKKGSGVGADLDGLLEVKEDVGEVTIHINDATSGSELKFGTGTPGDFGAYDFAADLDLDMGVPAGVTVNLEGALLKSPGQIDLNSQNVAGDLFIAGGNGNIVNGGDTVGAGLIYIAMDVGTASNPNSFSGEATFTNMGVEISTQAANIDGLIHATGNVTGQIGIGKGTTGNAGHLLSNGKIWVGGDVSTTGHIYVGRDALGDIQVDGDIVDTGRIEIDDELTGDISITGDLAGDVEVANDVQGDIDVGGNMTSGASIAVTGALSSEGRIRVYGLCDAPITIGKGTGANTLIRVTDGLDDEGSITINDSEGNFDADGEILIGDLSAFPTLPVTFDDCAFIVINDNGNGSYGDLGDHLRVVGCHASGHRDVDVCVDGNSWRWISIIQTGCDYPDVDHYCYGDSCQE